MCFVEDFVDTVFEDWLVELVGEREKVDWASTVESWLVLTVDTDSFRWGLMYGVPEEGFPCGGVAVR